MQGLLVLSCMSTLGANGAAMTNRLQKKYSFVSDCALSSFFVILRLRQAQPDICRCVSRLGRDTLASGDGRIDISCFLHHIRLYLLTTDFASHKAVRGKRKSDHGSGNHSSKLRPDYHVP